MKKKRIFTQFGDSLRHRLAGGVLCCLVLVAAYLFQILFPALSNNMFTLTLYLLIWVALFAGALLWTFREEKVERLPSQIVNVSYIAAFCLFIADQIHGILPKEMHEDLHPYFSNYTFLILVIAGLVVAGLAHFSLSLYRKLKTERQQSALRIKQFKKTLPSSSSEEKEVVVMRKLLENKPIISLFKGDHCPALIKGCQRIDPVFFAWLEKNKFKCQDRDIIFCVLIRLQKSKEEILTILGLDNGAYRTMKSRACKRLNLETPDMETFLQNLK